MLEKNAEHDWSTTFYMTQQPPVIDRVEFLVIPEDATRLAALYIGRGRRRCRHGRGADRQDHVARERPTASRSSSAPAAGVYYANLNHKMKPLDDLRVRQAISYAVDRESIVDLVLDGQGKPATSLLASAFGDYNPDVEPYTYDPEKAKALLAEAGHGERVRDHLPEYRPAGPLHARGRVDPGEPGRDQHQDR